MNIEIKDLAAFIRESNKIEGYHRVVTDRELEAATAFLQLETITVKDMETIVNVFAPGAKLRDKSGMDVRVGDYVAPAGRAQIREDLIMLLDLTVNETSPHFTHHQYETLHPFMDGNGRSGRMLWLWMMLREGIYVPERLFLWTWYYQSLEASR